jgi:hypothetical protein
MHSGTPATGDHSGLAPYTTHRAGVVLLIYPVAMGKWRPPKACPPILQAAESNRLLVGRGEPGGGEFYCWDSSLPFFSQAVQRRQGLSKATQPITLGTPRCN